MNNKVMKLVLLTPLAFAMTCSIGQTMHSAFAQNATGAEAKAQKPAAQSPDFPFRFVSGTITAIDRDAHTLTVSSMEGQVVQDGPVATFKTGAKVSKVIALSAETQLVEEEAGLRMNQIKVGDLISGFAAKDLDARTTELHFSTLEHTPRVVVLQPLSLRLKKFESNEFLAGTKALSLTQEKETSLITISQPEDVKLTRTKAITLDNLSIGEFVLVRYDKAKPTVAQAVTATK